MSLPLFGDDEAFLEAGTYPLDHGDEDLVGGPAGAIYVEGGRDALATAAVVWICDGLVDAMALSPRLPEGHVAATVVYAAKRLPAEVAAALDGKAVRIVCRADGQAGENGQAEEDAAAVAAAVAPVALETKIVKLAADPLGASGNGVREFLVRGGTYERLARLADATPPLAKRRPAEPDRGADTDEPDGAGAEPTIRVGHDGTAAVDAAVRFLAERPDVYQRGGRLVRIVAESSPPTGVARRRVARIAPIPIVRIREMLSAAKWIQDFFDVELRIQPPDWAVRAIEARAEWPGVRHLESIVATPVLRPDGTVLQTPGYDRQTGISFAADTRFPEVPAAPTSADVASAVDALAEVVCDFPFADDAHRGAWLAGLLTPLARHAFAGAAPLFLFDANTRGTGKSLLADTIAVLATGRGAARLANPRSDDECRKRITSIALAGEPLVLLDNVVGPLGHASLDAALSATTWNDRILGRSEMTGELPLLTTWYASGNNVVLVGSIARRTAHVRLESPEEHPETRDGFRHPNLLSWVRAERGRLVAAALTILRGFVAAGRPDQQLGAWGSFADWSDLIRQAIVWAGVADPGRASRELVDQNDREAAALRGLLAGWEELAPKGKGLTAAAALKQLDEHRNRFETLRTALAELVDTPAGKLPSPRQLGVKLGHLRRRVVDGKYFEQKISHKTNVWSVASADHLAPDHRR